MPLGTLVSSEMNYNRYYTWPRLLCIYSIANFNASLLFDEHIVPYILFSCSLCVHARISTYYVHSPSVGDEDQKYEREVIATRTSDRRAAAATARPELCP